MVNLWHFFVPQEGIPRSMTGNMLRIDWNDNPARADFLLNLTRRAGSA